MKKLIVILLVTQIISAQAVAKPGAILIRAVDTSDFALTQFIEIYNEHKSLSDYQMELRQNSQERKELIQKFERAQRDFLGNSFSKARDSYLKVVEFARQGAWMPKDRELIYSSYLRLAQIGPQQAAHWFEEAARFAIDLSPNPENFPPPLIQQASVVRSTVMNQIELWQPTFWDSAAMIIVDGRIYKSAREPAIPLTPGPHRIEVLSNLGPPDTRVLLRQQILEYVYSPKILVSGDCENPVVNSNPISNPSKLAVFYSIKCVKLSSEKGWVKLNSQGVLDLRPRNEYAVSEIRIPEIKENKSNRWLWWGLVGLAATGLYLATEKNKSGGPTVTATHESGLKE